MFDVALPQTPILRDIFVLSVRSSISLGGVDNMLPTCGHNIQLSFVGRDERLVTMATTKAKRDKDNLAL